MESSNENNETLGPGNYSINSTSSSENNQNPGGSNHVSKPPILQRRKSYFTPDMEDKFRRRLKFHFMGPDEKYKARRNCPWKLMVQIVKIVMVTAQLIQLGYSRSSFVEYKEKTIISLQHLFLKDWDSTYETMPYPAAIGKYALYRAQEVMDHVNFAMEQYDVTNSTAIGSLRLYTFPNQTLEPMKMCLKQYQSSFINSTTDTFVVNSTVTNPCYSIGSIDGEYNISKYTKNHSIPFTDIFDRLLAVTLKFSLKSYRLDMNQKHFPPQLYRLDVQIKMDDSNKDGQMLVSLGALLDEMEITGHSSDEAAERTQRIGLVVFDSFVVLISATSIFLCGRSVIRTQILRRETVKYFKKTRGKKLSLSDQFEFVNLWYVTIIINDVMTIIGSGYKIQLETSNIKSSSSNFDVCGLMLGTGSLLAWLGIIKYIGYFNQFNILIVTLKKAFPSLMRFMVCCMMLYIGFTICGWVVLGPYHIKFRQMSTASECLFSLVNGDDMFVTFSATITDNLLVWYYSRIYLYLFISLFIYAVLNLFIAVIMDTYETIKTYNTEGFPKSELFQFIDQCDDPAHSSVYRQEDNSCNPLSYICCCRQRHPDHPDGYKSF